MAPICCLSHTKQLVYVLFESNFTWPFPVIILAQITDLIWDGQNPQDKEKLDEVLVHIMLKLLNYLTLTKFLIIYELFSSLNTCMSFMSCLKAHNVSLTLNGFLCLTS